MSLGRSILLLTPSDNPLGTWKRGRDIYIQIFQLGLGNQNKSQHILHARNMVLGWEREKGNCYTVNTSPVSAPDLPWPHPCLGKPIGIAGNQTAICIKGVGMGAGRGKRKKTFLVQRQIGFLWY